MLSSFLDVLLRSSSPTHVTAMSLLNHPGRLFLSDHTVEKEFTKVLLKICSPGLHMLAMISIHQMADLLMVH